MTFNCWMSFRALGAAGTGDIADPMLGGSRAPRPPITREFVIFLRAVRACPLYLQDLIDPGGME
jgi:hypothetical protein